jgi:RNA polymerase sigma-70 factor (ECF subfamily)
MNVASFEHEYKAHFRFVYEFIYYRVQHRETAEDLTSTVFLKAFKSYGLFDATRASFKTWVATIARNVVADHWRAKRPEENIEDVWDALRDKKELSRDIDAKLRLELVETQMRTLTAIQREIILMRVWDGLSHAEIAEVLGKKEDAIKTAFSRGIRSLKKDLPLGIVLLSLLK